MFKFKIWILITGPNAAIKSVKSHFVSFGALHIGLSLVVPKMSWALHLSCIIEGKTLIFLKPPQSRSTCTQYVCIVLTAAIFYFY